MSSLHRRWEITLALLAAALLVTFVLQDYLREGALHSLPNGFKNFSLSSPPPRCARWREHMPADRDPAAYRLYIDARKVWRSKIGWQLTRAETTRILTDVSKAADLGDWGARALMAHFYLYGLGSLESNHVLDANAEKATEIQRMAARELQPWALYDLGVAYENGYGGVPHDEQLAWAYYLRAAQLGSPEAQMALASAYGRAGRVNEEDAMLKCAYEQGHGPAAYELALNASIRQQFLEALQIYQEGVKYGGIDCARDLSVIFQRGYLLSKSDEEKQILTTLGIGIDREREARYEAILEALKVNPDLKLGRLDQVVPLPPAQLPPWSGVDDAVDPESSGPPSY